MGSLAVCTPLILVFLLVGGILGAVALAGVGAAVVGSFGITMVMAQQYLPGNIGMASGLAVGFAIGLGGVAAVILGAVADSIDLRTSLFVSAGGAARRARAGDDAARNRGAPPPRGRGGGFVVR